MSSEDETYETRLDSSSKKRKVTRACDACRRRKVKCDVLHKPEGERCTNCVQTDQNCTFVESSVRRGPPRGYLESLEVRVARLEALLNTLHPGIDFTPDVGPPVRRDTFVPGGPADLSRWNRKATGRSAARKSARSSPGGAELSDAASAVGAAILPAKVEMGSGAEDARAGWESSASVSEAEDSDDLAHYMSRLAIHRHDRRFHGKSNSFRFVSTIDDIRPSSGSPSTSFAQSFLSGRREKYWSPTTWEVADATSELDVPALWMSVLPPDDLLHSLVELYFKHVNSFRPLLHRPTFEKELRERRLETSFVSKALLVCAVASRYSTDPRVVVEQDREPDGSVKSWLSAGWIYYTTFKQIKLKIVPFVAPSADDLQISALLAMFLSGGPLGAASWAVSAMGLVVAQDIGAHRRTPTAARDPVDAEMRKRAFWCLYWMDREASAALGRPCMLREEDFDAELPKVLPEEIGTEMEGAVAYFNVFLGLMNILGIALQTIYTAKPPLRSDVSQAQQAALSTAELESRLNAWLESMPESLRWNPDEPDTLRFSHLCNIQSAYYTVKIYVHRAFIHPRRPSPLRGTALAICANAARSAVHVLDVYSRRPSYLEPGGVNLLLHAFTSAIVLLATLWTGQRTGLVQGSPDMAMADVRICIDLIQSYEDRYLIAGKLVDVLNQLVKVSDAPPVSSSAPTQSATFTSNPSHVSHAPFTMPLGSTGVTAVGESPTSAIFGTVPEPLYEPPPSAQAPAQSVLPSPAPTYPSYPHASSAAAPPQPQPWLPVDSFAAAAPGIYDLFAPPTGNLPLPFAPLAQPTPPLPNAGALLPPPLVQPSVGVQHSTPAPSVPGWNEPADQLWSSLPSLMADEKCVAVSLISLPPFRIVFTWCAFR